METANAMAAEKSDVAGNSMGLSNGWELCGAAQTLLHQHAVQGDLSGLQAALARFAAACRLNSDSPLNPK